MSSSRFKFSCGFRRRGTPPGSAKVSSLSFFRRRTLNTCHPPAGSPGVEINSFAASQSSPLPHNDPAEPTNTSVEPSAPVHGLPFCGLPQGKIVSISMGRCRRKHLGVEICNCDLGQYIGPIDTESAICYRCDHLLSLHDDFPLDQSGDTTSSPHHPAVFDNSLATFAATTPLFEFDSHISRRIRLVDEMLAQVYTSYVIHVRGTPMTGKSTLAQLVARRSAETSPGTTTVFITWAVLGEHGRKSNMNYQDFIVAESSGRLVHSDFLMPRAPILIIIDEAQLSYDESRFWLEFIKKQATDYRTPELRVILFSSWGSASEDVLTFQGSAPITLLETQRVESIEQSGWPHRMALAFSFEEAEELVARFLPNSWVSPEVARELVRLSNGHPGVTHGLLKCIEKAEHIRQKHRHGHDIDLSSVLAVWTDSNIVADMRVFVSRSLPRENVLASHPGLVDLMLKVLENHWVMAEKVEDFPGLEVGHRKGYLHASWKEGKDTYYCLPSQFHHRIIQRMLLHPRDRDPGVSPFDTVKSLCLDTLRDFNPGNLSKHRKLIPRAPSLTHIRCSEAQYAAELFRCIFKNIGAIGNLQFELTFAHNGRLDMFIAEKHWGIELVQNANETSLTEHLMRFDPGGKYHQWGIIKDWIVLNFCTRFPAAKMACFNPRLYHVLFDEGHTNFTVVDSSLEKVEVPLTRLLYSS